MAILSMLLVLALVPLYLWKRRQDNSQSSEDHREEQQAPQRENVVRGAATRRMRRRPASGASTSSVRAATVEGWCMMLSALFFLSPFLFPFAESFVKLKYLISMFSMMYLVTLTIDGENREN